MWKIKESGNIILSKKINDVQNKEIISLQKHLIIHLFHSNVKLTHILVFHKKDTPFSLSSISVTAVDIKLGINSKDQTQVICSIAMFF